MNARCLHNFDVYPGWHPFIHVPSTWLHCDISLQYPHAFEHLSPNIPSVHSKDMKKMYYKQDINYFEPNLWYFLRNAKTPHIICKMFLIYILKLLWCFIHNLIIYYNKQNCTWRRFVLMQNRVIC